MQIVMLTVGSFGDVQPFVMLGRALQARGHGVAVATGTDCRDYVEGAGLAYRPLGSDLADYAANLFVDPKVQAAIAKSPSIYRMALAAPKPTAAQQHRFTEEMVEAGDGADLIVNSNLTRIGALVRPGVPWCTVSAWPVTPTGEFPALGAPSWPLGGGYNRFTHRASASMEWMLYRPSVNRGRRAVGAGPLGLRSPFLAIGRDVPILYPYSAHVLPVPGDWPERCHVTGYWFDDEPAPRPDELAAFLDRGDAPLVATFGSSWRPCGTKLLAATYEAVRRVGCRLVLVGGPDADPPAGLDVHRVPFVDYPWLFARAAGVLHHGGQGTVGHAVRAGIPQVAIPCFSDQPVWAARIPVLGVGPAPIPFAGLDQANPGPLVAALRSVLVDKAFTGRAAELAEPVRNEHGLDNACDVVETFAGTDAQMSSAS
jgi:sterol 3beta-glucosyltransferase